MVCSKIMVSIAMITYNHERFIAEAINSVLMQKVDYSYEIVIGDDCSNDDTVHILNAVSYTHLDVYKRQLWES